MLGTWRLAIAFEIDYLVRLYTAKYSHDIVGVLHYLSTMTAILLSTTAFRCVPVEKQPMVELLNIDTTLKTLLNLQDGSNTTLIALAETNLLLLCFQVCRYSDDRR